MAIATKNNATLNSNHYYFLLVDNGTSGKYGGEILLRKRFERFLLKQTSTHTGWLKLNKDFLDFF